MSIIPIILCGGSGSRLWPVSREHHPKQFIRLDDNQSFLQKAFSRACAIDNISEIITVTNQELFFKTQAEYQELLPNPNLELTYLLEPFGKNTAAAIAAAALYLESRGFTQKNMLILAADHLIADEQAFRQAIRQASELADLNKLVTFGIEPTRPETGYGYIEVSLNAPIESQVKDFLGYEVSSFVEKPSLDTAEEYLRSKNYLWNSGMFCFKVGVLLESMQLHCPDILDEVRLCLKESSTATNTHRIYLNAKFFSRAREQSIDYALLEPATALTTDQSVVVVPCEIGWNDMGSWNALEELSKPDEKGNRITGQALVHNSTNCYIQSPSRMVGVVGLDNLIIIDTSDALLVADKTHSQSVKNLYTELKSRNHEAYKLHRTVHRPWGTYTVLEESSRFKIKRIEVNPGASLSLQMHHHRSEHWIVVSGMAKVVNGEQEKLIATNQSTYIPAGNKHRLENPGVVNLIMIEVQSGEYLGEDDIVRFEDNYGRV